MSDYVRYKVVRYPIGRYKTFKELYDATDVFDKLPKVDNIYGTGAIDYRTDEVCAYIDYELFTSYGEECDDFGRTRALTEKEQDKYEPIFKDFVKGLVDIDKTKLRLVDYCYYNCCEPQAYYDETDDSFYDEV